MEEQTLISTYRELVRPLYAYVSRRCGSDRGLAEDVTQETWLRAVADWKQKGLPDNPLAWLKTVARNLIINYHRRTPFVSLDALPPGWEGGPLSSGDGDGSPDISATVSWGLARLRPAQARILEAFHLDGLKVREIAGDMGISERAVEGRLKRAREKLKKKLAPVVRSGGAPS